MKKFHYVIILTMSFLGLISCASHRTIAKRPVTRPLWKNIASGKTIPSSEKKEQAISIAEPNGELTMRQALSYALLNNPELTAFSYEVRAKEAWALQASLLPNPELESEIENFAGSGALSRFGESEFTLSVGQLIELGGKRTKRTRVAALEADLASWDYEAKRLDVFSQAVKAFIDVLASQEQVKLQQELVDVAEQFLQSINSRVKAGRVSPAEASRAKVELAATRIALQRAERELQTARRTLAASWGSTEAQFEKVAGVIDSVTRPPALEELQSFAKQNPHIARWVVELQQREAVLELEKAGRIPDPTIRGGYRRLNEIDDNAFVMSLSMPLMLFNRNQGAIQKAEYRKRQAEFQQKAVELSIKTRLAGIYHSLASAFQEVTSLKKNILPEAQNAFGIIKQGYLMGRFGFLDLLDAQRTLFEARSRYLNALRDYHQYVAEIERLIGQSLNDIQ